MPTTTDARAAADRRPPPAGRRVLVTGGAGFIGSHLVDHLLSRGDSVTVIDDLSTGRRANLPAGDGPVRFIRARVSEALPGFGHGDRFDEIYHLAASVGVMRVVARPIDCIENNILETAAVLRFALDHGPAAAAPVLLASSSEVYGKGVRVPFREEDDVVFGPTSAPRWAYGASKAIDEYLALAHHARDGLPVVIARLFNTVGPRQVGEHGMVLPRFVRAALEGRDLEVFGDGGQSRCVCDVRDVVPALTALLATPGARGRVYNVGFDQPITVLELARTVVRTLGSGSAMRRISYDQAYGPGFEDLHRRIPDLSRLRAEIGWSPRFTLEQSIADLAEWMSSESPRGEAAPV